MRRLGPVAGRHPAAVPTAVTLTLSAVTLLVVLVTGGAAAAPRSAAPAAASRADLVAKGRALYLTGCSTCHGLQGQGAEAPDGSERGPSLKRAGEAAAYYYLHTGRMPLANSEDMPRRREPAYGQAQMDALVAYVGSLGRGPAVPRVDLAKGNLTMGGEIFRGNCAACHSASGAGGALSYGRAAPSLNKAEPLEIGSAVRIGPGQMPRFGRDTISPAQLDAVARYVTYLRKPDDPGGLALGRIGPIPEGFLIWVFGMGLVLVTVAWIGKRNPPALTTEAPEETEGSRG